MPMLILTLCLSLCLSVPAWAATYFMSPAGSDGATGTAPGSPWKTFSKAFGSTSCGDTLVLLDGTYDGSNSGYARLDGRQCASGRPFTIRAQNERQAYLRHDGTSAGGGAGGYITNSSYIVVDGLQASTMDNNCCGVTNPFAMANVDHVTVRKMLAHTNNRYGNSHIIDVQNSTNVVFEDIEIYNFHRHGLAAQNVYDSIFRRVYCHSRHWPASCPAHYGCTGAVAEGDPSGGDSCIAIYPGSRNIVENSISEENGALFEINGESEEVVDNQLFGSISLKENQLGRVDTRDRPACSPHCYGRRTLMQHMVTVQPQRQGFLNTESIESRCDNCSVFNSRAYGHTSDGWGDDTTSFFADNNLIVNAATVAFNFVRGGSFLVRNANVFGNAATQPASSSNFQNMSTADPKMGSCLVYIPDASPLKKAGVGGADIGASILKRYQDGQLTTQPLWDPTTGAFPCGAVVAGVNDTAAMSCRGVHARLNVNTNGCPFPQGSGGGGGTPPVATLPPPTNLRLIGP